MEFEKCITYFVYQINTTLLFATRGRYNKRNTLNKLCQICLPDIKMKH